MSSPKHLTSLSKFISLVLRHQPETIGLVLDNNGWAHTTALLEKMNHYGQAIDFDLLEQVVITNSKQRFAFNHNKTKIRANQGHSIEVDLQLQPVTPPPVLYHGTGGQSVASILQTGLQKQQRQHVHLSSDTATVAMVGKRHGVPAILLVDAAKMQEDGFTFYLSDNGVWLADSVPPGYLRRLDELM